jgi:DNA-binding SARP family transcriptional activator
VEFRILGPLEVEVAGQRHDIGGPRLRALLAALLVRHNDRVPVDELVGAVWADASPADARAALQTYVARVRRFLRTVGSTARIEHAPAGYRLVVPVDAVDLAVFRALLGQAERQEGAQAAATLRAALALWRGAPLADIHSEQLQLEVVPQLDELRLSALHRRLDLDLAMGRSDEVVGDLRALTDRHPLREKFWWQLMTALYRCGRRAEALDAFRTVSRKLSTELGVEPGTELRDLHAAILEGEALAPGPPAVDRPVPAQLPADLPVFTGRDRELAALSDALIGSAAQCGTGVIAAISGPGGIGKTLLALHWAHRYKEGFPDGQLYVNLRGFDPAGQVLAPETALCGFLDSLGVRPQSMPVGVAAQAGLYRTLAAGRRMLVMLDNARDSAHVTDLLPGSAGSAVIVTSRDRLTGLVTGYGARPVLLDVLDAADSRRVLTKRLGDRITAQDELVTEVVTACGGLPLALGIAAARTAVQPRPSLALVAAELRDSTTRLCALDEENPQSSLRAVLSSSYAALTDEQARVFALLGVAPGPDIGQAAVGALTGLPVTRVSLVLRALERQSLVNQHVAGRWRMHDLVRLYAVECARERICEPDRRAALRTIVDCYLHTAYAADRRVRPSRHPIALDGSAPDGIPSFPDEATALAWLRTEQSCLLAAQQLAADEGWHVAVWQLAWAMDTVNRWGGQLREHVATWRLGLAAAQRTGDPASLVVVRRVLGHAYARAGRHDQAAEQLGAALALAERSGDKSAQAFVHQSFAKVSELAGHGAQALEHATRALRLYQATGETRREPGLLNAVGWYAARQGLHELARSHLEAALALGRSQRSVLNEAGTLDSLGYLAHSTGDHVRAVSYYRDSAALHHRLGDAYCEAETLEHLGDAYAGLGDREAAGDAWRRALGLYQAQHRIADTERVQRQLDH